MPLKVLVDVYFLAPARLPFALHFSLPDAPASLMNAKTSLPALCASQMNAKASQAALLTSLMDAKTSQAALHASLMDAKTSQAALLSTLVDTLTTQAALLSTLGFMRLIFANSLVFSFCDAIFPCSCSRLFRRIRETVRAFLW